jgi:drug/metabolite transporter (DMT)-like permease
VVLIGALAALAAALCWTLASSLWRALPTSLSAGQLNLLKNLLAAALLWPLVWGRPWAMAPQQVLLLGLSGVVGIAMGDSLYFAALRRLGTRRTLTLDAGGPAVTAMAGMVWLSERPTGLDWLGLVLITSALLLVATRQTGPGESARRQWQGVVMALGALLCGSSGALLSRAALRDFSVDPLQSALMRLLAATVVLLPLLMTLPRGGLGPKPAHWRWPLALLATLLGTTAGIALQQTALQRLPGGLAVALLATAPVMALPLAALEGDRPGWRGWCAALLALAGVSCVVL